MSVDPLSAALLSALIRRDLDSWDEWRRLGGSFDSLATRKLLALGYDLLRSAGRSADPSFAAGRESYRQTWRRTELILVRVRQSVAQLALAGIPTVLLKGVALVDRFYGDHGLRPMSDFDLLVREPDMSRSVEILAGLDWTPMTRVPVSLMPRHDYTLAHRGGGECDLHRRLYPGADDALTESIFQSAQTARLHDTAVLLPSDADLLFHAIVHGWRMNGGDLLAAIDVARIIRRNEIDWSSLVRRAAEQRQAQVVRTALEEVAAVAAFEIAEPVLHDLGRQVGSDAPVRGTSRTAQLVTMSRRGGRAGMAAFIHLLEEDWNMPAARLPLEALRRIRRRTS